MTQDHSSHFAQNWLKEHGDALYSYALLQCKNEEQAGELVQETLLAAIESYQRFSGKSSLRTWLIGILKRKAIDQFRRSMRETAIDDLTPMESGVDKLIEQSFQSDGHWSFSLKEWGKPEQLLEQEQFSAQLNYCLSRLPLRLRQLFVLREIFDEKSEKVCQELQISATNLWTMLYRARMGLRHCIESHWK